MYPSPLIKKIYWIKASVVGVRVLESVNFAKIDKIIMFLKPSQQKF